MSLIVYGDFNCPFSYLASLRVTTLIESGADIRWRAVEHAPAIPVPGSRLDAAAQQEIRDELAAVRGVLAPGEELDAALPAMTPHTQAAVSAYAEADGAGVGDAVRTLLFDAYWVHGLDIGSPDVLRSLLAAPIMRGGSTALPLRWSGFAVSANRGPITVDAYKRIANWRTDWLGLSSRTIPALVDGGSTYTGFDALARLAARLPATTGVAA